MSPMLLALSAVLCIAVGQILFKTTAMRIEGRPFLSALEDWRTVAIFGSAIGIYVMATILWVLALRDLQLARAYMLMSLSFVIVPSAAMILFGERLSSGFFLGLSLIMAGLALTLRT